MKKALTLNGPMALVTIGGLVGLQLVSGLDNTLFRFAIDGGIVVVLLTSSDQILLTCLVFLIQLGKKISILFRTIVSLAKRVIRFLKRLVPFKKEPSREVNLHPLVIAVILIIAGLLSPSNGVDSARHLSTYALLVRAMIILATGVGFFIVYRLLGGSPKGSNSSNVQDKGESKTREKQSAVREEID